MLDRLEADFRLVDEAHAAGSAQLLPGSSPRPGRSASSTGRTRRQRSSAAPLPSASPPFDLQTTAPHLSRTVAPVWLASPYEVHEITDRMPFDTVILVDAGATTLAENVGAIRRAKQVVAFGDPVTQTPAPFDRIASRRSTRRTPSRRTVAEDAAQDDAARRLGARRLG